MTHAHRLEGRATNPRTRSHGDTGDDENAAQRTGRHTPRFLLSRAPLVRIRDCEQLCPRTPKRRRPGCRRPCRSGSNRTPDPDAGRSGRNSKTARKRGSPAAATRAVLAIEPRRVIGLAAGLYQPADHPEQPLDVVAAVEHPDPGAQQSALLLKGDRHALVGERPAQPLVVEPVVKADDGGRVLRRGEHPHPERRRALAQLAASACVCPAMRSNPTWPTNASAASIAATGP